MHYSRKNNTPHRKGELTKIIIKETEIDEMLNDWMLKHHGVSIVGWRYHEDGIVVDAKPPSPTKNN